MKTLLLLFVYASLFGFDDVWGADRPAMGWKPTPHGVKAAPIQTHPAYKVAPLPSSASVAQWYFRTDQRDRGACVAFSTWEAYAATFAKTQGARLDLSPLDIYQQCLVLDRSFPHDNGTYGSTTLKVMLKSGALTEKSWPYSMPLTMLPPVNDATKQERSRNLALKAYAIPSNDGGYATKFAISKLQIGVMVGSYWYGNGFEAKRVSCKTKDLSGKSATVLRWVLPMPKGNPVGGHEVVITAYDDNMVFPKSGLFGKQEVGGVEIHNHWGPGWGDERGACWIPYAWAFSPRYADDKCCIELVSQPAKPAPKSDFRVSAIVLTP